MWHLVLTCVLCMPLCLCGVSAYDMLHLVLTCACQFSRLQYLLCVLPVWCICSVYYPFDVSVLCITLLAVSALCITCLMYLLCVLHLFMYLLYVLSVCCICSMYYPFAVSATCITLLLYLLCVLPACCICSVYYAVTVSSTCITLLLYLLCVLRYCCICYVYYAVAVSALCITRFISPWYNRTGWLGVKHQLTYLPVWFICLVYASLSLFLRVYFSVWQLSYLFDPLSGFVCASLPV